MDVSGRSGEMMVFATVMDQGSLSAAARVLNLTPSAVSRVVARIEARLGVRLLIRTTRALSLTAEGQAYLRAARRILSDLTEVEEAIADQASPRGRVRLTASLAYGRLYVVPLLAEFTARYPNILVDLNLSDRVVDVLGGQADVAIRFGQLVDSPLTARRIGETGRVVVASPAYLARHGTPEQPEDLFRHNCLSFNFRRAEPGWPFRRADVDMALAVTGSIEANSGESLAQLALAGVGIARIGMFAVMDEIAEGRLIPLLEPFNPQDREPLHLLFVGGATMPARVRVLIDFLVERLGESV
ncbi:LysR family transcriptional regulator [Brevundimonas sp. SORGH_AS_0993]|uniref:LysR family transcriptional regulator n=1 Tax=Brevundimonas sp. SORGH_AS_0993 TaxID=3041794 RepID=UPI0027890B5F|nr:LysR family transcriptional regulator [Brevundimonas sp. SORGH_AS_0993]MDQ1153387.1 DNA-binding transcriptional LysR family regulator [Brevundimonas sp. SORGH_AS_0993]